MIDIEKNGQELLITVEGRLDMNTAPEFDRLVVENCEGMTSSTVDLSGCPYISSAGIRSILSLQKKMIRAGGDIVVTNIAAPVMKVFEDTGLCGLLTLMKR